jgi:hypothetical protein
MKIGELFEAGKGKGKKAPKAEPVEVDQKGKTHEGCGGKFQETSQHDDANGTLHCSECNKQVKRWLSEGVVFEGASKAAQKLEDAIVGNWLKLSVSQIVKKVKGWPEFKGMTDAQLEDLVDDAHYQAHNQVDESLMVEGAYVIKNTAGVEKRFKDASSEAAKLWKASGLKASKPSAVPKEKFSQAWWQYQEDKDKNYEKTMPWTKIDKHDLDSASLKAAFSSAGWNENNVDDWSVVGGSGNVKVKGVNCAALTLRVVYMFTKDDDMGVEGDDPVSDSEYITIARSPTDPKKYVFVRHGQLR